jgi:acyl-CoA thioesterase I
MQRTLTKLKNGEKVTIIALGDSNTEITWHTRGQMNWVGLLTEALFETYGRNRCFVMNSSRCGGTAAEALTRLDEDVLRFDPDLVIISFGMNEAYGSRDVGAFKASMTEIIKRVRAHNSAEILLRTPNPVINPPGCHLAEGQSSNREAIGSIVGELAAAAVALGKELGCPVVDHYSIWRARMDVPLSIKENPNALWLAMSDNVHTGPLGHRYFFRELAPLFGVATHFPWEVSGA